MAEKNLLTGSSDTPKLHPESSSSKELLFQGLSRVSFGLPILPHIIKVFHSDALIRFRQLKKSRFWHMRPVHLLALPTWQGSSSSLLVLLDTTSTWLSRFCDATNILLHLFWLVSLHHLEIRAV